MSKFMEKAGRFIKAKYILARIYLHGWWRGFTGAGNSEDIHSWIKRKFGWTDEEVWAYQKWG